MHVFIQEDDSCESNLLNFFQLPVKGVEERLSIRKVFKYLGTPEKNAHNALSLVQTLIRLAIEGPRCRCYITLKNYHVMRHKHSS